jgi:predicted LPLAT superfamily acyltransferase
MRRSADPIASAPPVWITRHERAGMAAIRAGVRLAIILGRTLSRALLVPVCLYFVAVSPAERAASRRFLARALGRRAGLGDLLRHFHAFATTLLDRVYLLRGQYGRFEVRAQGEELVTGLARDGQGCLLLGAHLGSFEILRFLGTRMQGRPVNLVMYRETARKLNAVLESIDPRHTTPVIALGSIDSMLAVDEALARGEFVGILADRTIRGDRTVPCPFLGADARFPMGPFRLAAMLGRPVVLMLGLYRGANRYDVVFETLFDARGVPRAEREAAVEEAIRAYAARLEHYARLAPYNWFNFYDYWQAPSRNGDHRE